MWPFHVFKFFWSLCQCMFGCKWFKLLSIVSIFLIKCVQLVIVSKFGLHHVSFPFIKTISFLDSIHPKCTLKCSSSLSFCYGWIGSKTERVLNWQRHMVEAKFTLPIVIFSWWPVECMSKWRLCTFITLAYVVPILCSQ